VHNRNVHTIANRRRLVCAVSDMSWEGQRANCDVRFARKDSEISPTTAVPPRPIAGDSRADIAPWESEPPQQQVSGQSGNMQSAKPQTQSRPSQMVSSVFPSYYNDSSENLGQISPGSTAYPDDDDRRPSIASATTVSSSGSTSNRIHKKLQGFFRDDYRGLQEDSRQGSETSSLQSRQPTPAQQNVRGGRYPQNSKDESSPPSPSSSRPRTPAAGANSEVTPWDFRDSQVWSSPFSVALIASHKRLY